MSADDELLDSAMKLPPNERADLVLHLLRSLEDKHDDPDAETAWKSEIEDRLAVVAAGNYEASDWRDAIADIRKSMKEGRKP